MQRIFSYESYVTDNIPGVIVRRKFSGENLFGIYFNRGFNREGGSKEVPPLLERGFQKEVAHFLTLFGKMTRN